MTSKEAFEHIIFDAKMEKPIFSMYYQEFLKPIEKDLEVLDILKKNLYYDNENHVIKMKRIKKSTFNFDYEDLKEWLENE